MLLSEWGLFSDMRAMTPADDVVPYAINAPLFSDYAVKRRYVRLPPGGTITIDAAGRWHFPDGSVIVKTFGFLFDERDPSLGERTIETRLLSREDSEWVSYVYVWNEAQTDAVLELGGRRVPVEFIDASGAAVAITYRIPTEVQCGNCHGGTGPTEVIGIRTEQMDHPFDYGDGAGPVNVIDHMDALGMFASPPPAPALRAPLPYYFDASADLDARARAYLDANCAHCHRDGGAADQSGLWLGAHETELVRRGICKTATAAGRGTGGRRYVIWPGEPDASIATFRMASTEPGIKMPELPTVLSHTEGVALITEWIAAMPPVDCAATSP
jgi:uncharacterized repeat protein (TIGR03806 family)